MGELVFLGIASLVIFSAFGVVVSSSLVHSAVALLFTLFGVAGLYIFLYADFLAATQVVVYVGGILVLIIFGVMLTNKIDTPSIASSSSNQVVGAIVSLLLFAFQLGVIFKTDWHIGDGAIVENTVRPIGLMLLNEYLLPFEVVSILLLGALIGASMLSRKN
ncbi:MAG: NADH-quinone oxidoreductase subunit J [Candidatus Marinimicrobia bacterium]|nr:NADH-quinone oxidoreductase subunit J [Candidatus Neomarinimicrobiota bacterium]